MKMGEPKHNQTKTHFAVVRRRQRKSRGDQPADRNWLAAGVIIHLYYGTTPPIGDFLTRVFLPLTKWDNRPCKL